MRSISHLETIRADRFANFETTVVIPSNALRPFKRKMGMVRRKTAMNLDCNHQILIGVMFRLQVLNTAPISELFGTRTLVSHGLAFGYLGRR